MADAALPPSRAILTSLLNALTSLPQQQQQQQQQPQQPQPQQPQNANPFKSLPPSARPLLATLHVLYPAVLLPALDLLDRRLVTRILLLPTSPSSPSSHSPSSTPFSLDDTAHQPAAFHLVRSARHQHPLSRRAGAGSSTTTAAAGPVYVVRPDAWNCSCAAFAFAAFPPERSRSHYYHYFQSEDDGDDDNDHDDGGIPPWEFGGLSSDGRLGGGGGGGAERDGGAVANENGDEAGAKDGGEERSGEEVPGRGEGASAGSSSSQSGVGSAGVPCCKHLLACVLAERWPAVLAGHVEERRVGREEAAGLMAGV